jgi:hypothetical protein
MENPAAAPPPDPIALIRQLDPDGIRNRLAQMEQERQALLVLLRAALAARPAGRRGVADAR